MDALFNPTPIPAFPLKGKESGSLPLSVAVAASAAYRNGLLLAGARGRNTLFDRRI